MKLLVISPNYPFPADKGERIRVNGIIQLFTDLKYQVDLVSLDSRSDLAINKTSFNSLATFKISKIAAKLRMLKHLFLNQSLTSAHYQEPSFTKLIQQKLTNTNYDLILLFSSAFDYLIPILAKHQVKVFWDLIDFDSLKWAKYATQGNYWKCWLYQREAQLIKKAEEQIIQFANLVSVISGREITRYQLNSKVKNNIFVLPQPFEVKDDRGQQKQKFQLIFTGQMDYSPNIEAVIFFDQQVMPILSKKYPEIKFKVVGRNPSPELICSCPRTVFTGEVADIHSELAESTIAVAPLKSVFGVPIKVLDALSHGLATVVTSDVAETIGARSGVDLMVADSAEEFALAIQHLLQNNEIYQKISNNARKLIQQKFNRDSIKGDLASRL